MSFDQSVSGTHVYIAGHCWGCSYQRCWADSFRFISYSDWTVSGDVLPRLDSNDSATRLAEQL